MAATEQPGPATDPRACGSAPEFVRDRLGEAESPMSPAELSDEYDCAGGYMRDVLSDLAAEGVVEAVDHVLTQYRGVHTWTLGTGAYTSCEGARPGSVRRRRWVGSTDTWEWLTGLAVYGP